MNADKIDGKQLDSIMHILLLRKYQHRNTENLTTRTLLSTLRAQEEENNNKKLYLPQICKQSGFPL